MRKLCSFGLICILFACSGDKTSRLDFLIGTWKIEGEDQFEVWETGKNKELIGYLYKLENKEKFITETLSIKTVDNQTYYEATVPDQNDGRTIRFTLNNEIKAYLSFENMEHDFPKLIQYKRISDDEIEVTVLGDEGKGFSFSQFKQP